jgi:hypothetical protein
MVSPVERYQIFTDYLKRHYPSAMLYKHGGTLHPIVFHAAGDSDTIDSVLGAVPDERITDFAFYNHAYLQTMQNSQRNLFNGTTFALKKLRLRPLQISAYLGRYFDMLATCTALEHELRESAFRRFIRLPQRKMLHADVAEDRALTDGTGRSATIGGAVLVVYRHPQKGYRAILSRRTAQHATHPGHYHLLPAFVFQPAGDVPQPHEWNMRYHIEREWLEELFGLPEHTEFSDHPALTDLHRMEAAGDAELHLTGIAVSLLSLRPEICALLLIHDPDWWQRIHAPDSEMPLNTSAEAEDNLLHVPLNLDDAQAFLPLHLHTKMPPQGFVALHEGLRLARSLVAANE